MKIIDNFLEEKEFKKIQQTMMGFSFPWYYHIHSSYEGDFQSSLTYMFYNFEVPGKSAGAFSVTDVGLELLYPVLRKLKSVALVRIKANLTFPNKEKHFMHTDFKFKGLKTAIYYINTNDGGTKIKNKFVKSIENRIVIMPSSMSHSTVRHTDTAIGRFVINFNYYEEQNDAQHKGFDWA